NAWQPLRGDGRRSTSIVKLLESGISGGDGDDLLKPSLPAKNPVLLGAKSVCKPARRKDDVVIGQNRVFGNVSLQQATLYQPFRQKAVSAHFVSVHRLAVGHVHSVVVKRLAGTQVAFGYCTHFDDGPAQRLRNRI